MKETGFKDFERGERGSTAEHLSDMEYKTKKESERADEMAVVADKKEKAVAVLDEQVDKKTKQLDKLEEKIIPAKKAAATIEDIERMGKKRTLGGLGADIAVSPVNWKKVSELAKEGLNSRGIIADLKKKISELTKEITKNLKNIFGLNKKLEGYEGNSLMGTVKYHKANQKAPQRMAWVLDDILRQPPEKSEQEHKTPHRERSRMMADSV